VSEQVEIFQAMRDARKEQRREWKRINMEALDASGLRYRSSNKGECLTFFGPNGAANFYPSTDRWRFRNQTYSGGASKFIIWWAKQQ